MITCGFFVVISSLLSDFKKHSYLNEFVYNPVHCRSFEFNDIIVWKRKNLLNLESQRLIKFPLNLKKNQYRDNDSSK